MKAEEKRADRNKSLLTLLINSNYGSGILSKVHTHITICHVNGCFAKATDDSARPPSMHPHHVCQPT